MLCERKSSATNSIEFHGVSVRHPLVHRRIPTFKEWLVRGGSRDEVDHWFMALKDVSFEVPAGDTLGVIGSNGAGKSTLLRVAAGIITPTSGYAVIRGSIAPLIELGTGFDGELTGLENIFFNGALLGRTRAEIKLKVDEIANFADIGEFIDAPLRTYSTGMVSRLAFAIATTIDPDVLLLDEILSVGDASFQQKCKTAFWDSGTAERRSCSFPTISTPSKSYARTPSGSIMARPWPTGPRGSGGEIPRSDSAGIAAAGSPQPRRDLMTHHDATRRLVDSYNSDDTPRTLLPSARHRLRVLRRLLPRRAKRYLKRFWDPNQVISAPEAALLDARIDEQRYHTAGEEARTSRGERRPPDTT